MNREVSGTLFKAVGLIFSAVMLVLSLLTSIAITARNDSVQSLEKQVREFETENEILLAQCENSMSIEEIELYATQVLGMQHLRPEQMVYIEIGNGDMA